MRRWHQLVATSSTVRELDNEVYQLAHEEARIYKKQERNKKLSRQDTDALARLGRLREVADEVKRQREAAIALEDASVIAFHDGFEPTDDLAKQLAEANRDWDKLLLRLYSLNAPPTIAITLALFAEHRGHLAELAVAYRSIANAQGLAVQIVRYELPDERDNTAPQPTAPATEEVNDSPTVETSLPPTAWLGDKLFRVKPGPVKLLLVRKVIDPARAEEYTTRETLGLGVMISGAGAHVRYCGETGLHDIRDPESPDPANPAVLVFVSSETLLTYRPPETVVRKGLLKDRELRREYDLEKGEMRDVLLERVWTGMHGRLTNWLEPAIAANMRLRVLQMIME